MPNFCCLLEKLKEIKKKLYKIKKFMGETYQNLRAQGGKSVVVEREENLVIEHSENSIVKRKQTIIREKFEKDAISRTPRKEHREKINKKSHKSGNSNKSSNNNHPNKHNNKRDSITDPETTARIRDPEGTKRFSVPEVAELRKKIDHEIAILKKRRQTLLNTRSDTKIDVIIDGDDDGDDDCGDGVKHEKKIKKRNAAIQNDMTWDQNFNANNHNIHYTFERYSSSQQKLLTGKTKGERDERTTIASSVHSCRPRMRTIGLQKNTGRTARPKDFCGLAKNLKCVNSTVESIPTAFACFEYGPSCVHIGDCNHSSNNNKNNNNSSCQKYSQRYNMSGNYSGVICNQNTYVERGFTPCSEYNYCYDQYYYDYSQLPASGSHPPPCCCCCKPRHECCCSRDPNGHRRRNASSKKKNHRRHGSDLNTEEFYERRKGTDNGDNGRKRGSKSPVRSSKSPQRSSKSPSRSSKRCDEKFIAKKFMEVLTEQQCALEREELAKAREKPQGRKSRRKSKSRDAEGDSTWEQELREQLREESAAKIAALLTQCRLGEHLGLGEHLRGSETETTTTTDDQNCMEEEKLLEFLTKEAKKIFASPCPGENDDDVGSPSSSPDEMKYDKETLETLKTMRISEYKPGKGIVGEAKKGAKKNKQYEKYIKQYNKHDPDGSPVKQEPPSDGKEELQEEEIQVAALEMDAAYDRVKKEITNSSHAVDVESSKTYSKLRKDQDHQDIKNLKASMSDGDQEEEVFKTSIASQEKIKMENDVKMEWTPPEMKPQIDSGRNVELRSQEMGDQEMRSHVMGRKEIESQEMGSHHMRSHEVGNQEMRGQELERQEMRDQGMRDQGMRDQVMRDQMMRDQMMRDQGMRSQGLRDQMMRGQEMEGHGLDISRRDMRRRDLGAVPHVEESQIRNGFPPNIHDGFQREYFPTETFVGMQTVSRGGFRPQEPYESPNCGLNSVFQSEPETLQGGRRGYYDQEEAPRSPRKREVQETEIRYESREYVKRISRPDDADRSPRRRMVKDEPQSPGAWDESTRGSRSLQRSPMTSRNLTPRAEILPQDNREGDYFVSPERTQREEIDLHEFSEFSYNDRANQPYEQTIPSRPRLVMGKEESLLRSTLQNSIGSSQIHNRNSPTGWPESIDAKERNQIPMARAGGHESNIYPFHSTPRTSIDHDSGYPRSSRVEFGTNPTMDRIPTMDTVPTMDTIPTMDTVPTSTQVPVSRQVSTSRQFPNSQQPHGLSIPDRGIPQYIPGPRPQPPTNQYSEELREEGVVFRQGNDVKYGIRRLSDLHYEDRECKYMKETKEELEGLVPNEMMYNNDNDDDDEYPMMSNVSYQMDQTRFDSNLYPNSNQMTVRGQRRDGHGSSLQIPEFTGCPCMLETYLNLLTLMNDENSQKNDICRSRQGKS